LWQRAAFALAHAQGQQQTLSPGDVLRPLLLDGKLTKSLKISSADLDEHRLFAEVDRFYQSSGAASHWQTLRSVYTGTAAAALATIDDAQLEKALSFFQERDYAESLRILMTLAETTPALRFIYDSVQRIYSLRQQGKGEVVLKNG